MFRVARRAKQAQQRSRRALVYTGCRRARVHLAPPVISSVPGTFLFSVAPSCTQDLGSRAAHRHASSRPGATRADARRPRPAPRRRGGRGRSKRPGVAQPRSTRLELTSDHAITPPRVTPITLRGRPSLRSDQNRGGLSPQLPQPQPPRLLRSLRYFCGRPGPASVPAVQDRPPCSR